MIFGREPAVIAGAIKALVAVVCLTVFTGVTADGQTAINALAAAILGIIVAAQVSAEKALPLVVGLVEAGLYVAVAFGLNVSSDVQAALLVAVGAVVAVITRDRVTAKIPAAAAGFVARTGTPR